MRMGALSSLSGEEVIQDMDFVRSLVTSAYQRLRRHNPPIQKGCRSNRRVDRLLSLSCGMVQVNWGTSSFLGDLCMSMSSRQDTWATHHKGAHPHRCGRWRQAVTFKQESWTGLMEDKAKPGAFRRCWFCWYALSRVKYGCQGLSLHNHLCFGRYRRKIEGLRRMSWQYIHLLSEVPSSIKSHW